MNDGMDERVCDSSHKLMNEWLNDSEPFEDGRPGASPRLRGVRLQSPSGDSCRAAAQHSVFRFGTRASRARVSERRAPVDSQVLRSQVQHPIRSVVARVGSPSPARPAC